MRPTLATSVQTIRLMLVDDQMIVREGLRLLLENQNGLFVTGEAANLPDAVALAARDQPDLILLDLDLGDVHGLDCLPELLKGRGEFVGFLLDGLSDGLLLVYFGDDSVVPRGRRERSIGWCQFREVRQGVVVRIEVPTGLGLDSVNCVMLVHNIRIVWLDVSADVIAMDPFRVAGGVALDIRWLGTNENRGALGCHTRGQQHEWNQNREFHSQLA